VSTSAVTSTRLSSKTTVSRFSRDTRRSYGQLAGTIYSYQLRRAARYGRQKGVSQATTYETR
jgi:hypothetical protein